MPGRRDEVEEQRADTLSWRGRLAPGAPLYREVPGCQGREDVPVQRSIVHEGFGERRSLDEQKLRIGQCATTRLVQLFLWFKENLESDYVARAEHVVPRRFARNARILDRFVDEPVSNQIQAGGVASVLTDQLVSCVPNAKRSVTGKGRDGVLRAECRIVWGSFHPIDRRTLSSLRQPEPTARRRSLHNGVITC